MYFLVDTGSSWSLISNEIFESLLGNRDLEDLQTTSTTADGDLLSVKGKTDVDLCIKRWNFQQLLLLLSWEICLVYSDLTSCLNMRL